MRRPSAYSGCESWPVEDSGCAFGCHFACPGCGCACLGCGCACHGWGCTCGSCCALFSCCGSGSGCPAAWTASWQLSCGPFGSRPATCCGSCPGSAAAGRNGSGCGSASRISASQPFCAPWQLSSPLLLPCALLLSFFPLPSAPPLFSFQPPFAPLRPFSLQPSSPFLVYARPRCRRRLSRCWFSSFWPLSTLSWTSWPSWTPSPCSPSAPCSPFWSPWHPFWTPWLPFYSSSPLLRILLATPSRYPCPLWPFSWKIRCCFSSLPFYPYP
mmetsp:Transcript_65402/g.165718  ORF Transcript_65402/g.165718 Transcript_65402/m.165718 type:complete len:270 (-) Transcript_65402:859-1668(-)